MHNCITRICPLPPSLPLVKPLGFYNKIVVKTFIPNLSSLTSRPFSSWCTHMRPWRCRYQTGHSHHPPITPFSKQCRSQIKVKKLLLIIWKSMLFRSSSFYMTNKSTAHFSSPPTNPLTWPLTLINLTITQASHLMYKFCLFLLAYNQNQPQLDLRLTK